MLKIARWLGLSGGLMLAGATQAVMLDLTDGSWSTFNNHTSATRTLGSNQISLSTGGTGRLRFTGYDGGRSAARGSLAGVNDGVGIGDDEISYGSERLTARFSNAVTLNSVQFLDLFGAGPNGDPMAEGVGMLIEYASGDNTFLSAFGTEWGGAGYLDFAVGLADVMSISFFIDPQTGLPANSDFALAGLDLDWTQGDGQLGDNPVSGTNDPGSNDPRGPSGLIGTAQSVPEPALPGLMLLGLIMLAAAGGRRRRQTAPTHRGTRN
ncbi:MAG: PEP-CTERM sorting domain-containing protein [Nitrococcus mobilis]|nr:PEP-CTERM sorting domain-containing protein [Nitrococcus mobilis]